MVGGVGPGSGSPCAGLTRPAVGVGGVRRDASATGAAGCGAPGNENGVTASMTVRSAVCAGDGKAFAEPAPITASPTANAPAPALRPHARDRAGTSAGPIARPSESITASAALGMGGGPSTTARRACIAPDRSSWPGARRPASNASTAVPSRRAAGPCPGVMLSW